MMNLQTAAIALPCLTPQDAPLAYLASLTSAHSRAAMGRALTIAAQAFGAPSVDAFPWASLRYAHVEALRGGLLERGAAPKSVNLVLSAVRGVARALWRMEAISAEDHARIGDVEGVKDSRLPAGRYVTPAERAAIEASATGDGSSRAGKRNAALWRVLYGSGVRRSEFCALTLADYVATEGKLAVRSGKGRKDREVFVGPATVAAVEVWLVARGTEPGALFCPVNKGDRVEHRHMTPSAVWRIVGTLAERAGVAGLSPHDLRRSMVSDMLDKGVDIVTVQQLAGHADPATTSRYDRRGNARKARAAAMVDG